jgi:hypothetical protein
LKSLCDNPGKSLFLERGLDATKHLKRCSLILNC